jgi:hypothetical protein
VLTNICNGWLPPSSFAMSHPMHGVLWGGARLLGCRDGGATSPSVVIAPLECHHQLPHSWICNARWMYQSCFSGGVIASHTSHPTSWFSGRRSLPASTMKTHLLKPLSHVSSPATDEEETESKHGTNYGLPMVEFQLHIAYKLFPA